jgi:hypothetical protein
MRKPLRITGHPVRRFHGAELPAYTVEMARYLTGKNLVHDLAKGRMSGRIGLTRKADRLLCFH